MEVQDILVGTALVKSAMYFIAINQLKLFIQTDADLGNDVVLDQMIISTLNGWILIAQKLLQCRRKLIVGVSSSWQNGALTQEIRQRILKVELKA